MPEYVLARFVVAVPGVALLAIVTTLLVVFPAKLNGPAIYDRVEINFQAPHAIDATSNSRVDVHTGYLWAGPLRIVTRSRRLHVARRGMRTALYHRHRPGGGHLRVSHAV